MEFFLLHNGRGFTDAGVRLLTYGELVRRVKRLDKALKAEAEARVEAAKQVKAARRSRGR